MISDDDLQKMVIGELKPHNAPIELVEYDPEWPALFAREEARIRAALGDRALRVEHIGSTSVPGLPAKPLIDIILAVRDSADEPSYVPDLEAAGYVLRVREPGWYERRLFKGPEYNTNVHAYGVDGGADEISRMVMFRDWLRTHDDERELYERTKRELAQRVWRHVQHYSIAKMEVVNEILARASAG